MRLDRGSRTDVNGGRRFTGVFAKIGRNRACVSESAVNPICISQGFGPSFRPLVLIRCRNRLTSATRIILPSDMVAVARRTLPSST